MACGDVNEPWRFFCFRMNNQRGSILLEWFKDFDERERIDVLTEFRVLIGKLMVRTREKWVRPEFAPLTRWKGLYEIRFKKNKKQYRFIGCFGPGKCEFTILLSGVKNKSDFYRRNCQTVLERQKLVTEREEKIVEFKFTGNLE